MAKKVKSESTTDYVCHPIDYGRNCVGGRRLVFVFVHQWYRHHIYQYGKLYDRRERLMKDCSWYNGLESDISEYEGDGRKPINIAIKHLKLSDHCILRYWDVSLFSNLETIEIGSDSFISVKSFKIDGLNRLRALKIGKRSFTNKKNSLGWDESKSFHILNCESLESIEVDQFGFSDFAGDFEINNLPKLHLLVFGTVEDNSRNFYWGSFVVRSIDMMPKIGNS